MKEMNTNEASVREKFVECAADVHGKSLIDTRIARDINRLRVYWPLGKLEGLWFLQSLLQETYDFSILSVACISFLFSLLSFTLSGDL